MNDVFSIRTFIKPPNFDNPYGCARGVGYDVRKGTDCIDLKTGDGVPRLRGALP
jgi:hypothetical protein